MADQFYDIWAIQFMHYQLRVHPVNLSTTDFQFREKFKVKLARSEEHTSELQSRLHLVCRLLLEKKKTYQSRRHASDWESRPLSVPHALHPHAVPLMTIT